MDAVQRWLTLLTLVSAALAAVLYLARQTWRGFRVLEQVAAVVQHELSPNHGSSMKDDVAAIARAVGALQGQYDEDKRDALLVHGALQVQLDAIYHELRMPPPRTAGPGRHEREGTHVSSNQARQDDGEEQHTDP